MGLFSGGMNAASTLSVVTVVIYGANLTIKGSTASALTSFILCSLTGKLSVLGYAYFTRPSHMILKVNFEIRLLNFSWTIKLICPIFMKIYNIKIAGNYTEIEPRSEGCTCWAKWWWKSNSFLNLFYSIISWVANLRYIS